MVSYKEAEEVLIQQNNLMGVGTLIRVNSPDHPSSMTFHGISGMQTGTFGERIEGCGGSSMHVLSR